MSKAKKIKMNDFVLFIKHTGKWSKTL